VIRHIMFRCAQCRGTTSVQAEWTRPEVPTEIACADCNAVYSLPARRDRGVSNRDYYEKARRFASQNNIDLPSAFSVLEGILPPEKVRALAKGSPELGEPKQSSNLKTLAMLGAVVIALAFVGGFYRDRIASKLSLDAGRNQRETTRVGATRQARRPTLTRPPAQEPAAALGPILVRANETGAVTQVSGPDPKGTLAAFCRQPGMPLKYAPVTVSDASPPNPGLRVGVLRSIEGSGELFTIPIWLDAATSQWSVGDGRVSIRPAKLDVGAASPTPAAVPGVDHPPVISTTAPGEPPGREQH
jgi:hypothetical protein